MFSFHLRRQWFQEEQLRDFLKFDSPGITMNDAGFSINVLTDE